MRLLGMLPRAQSRIYSSRRKSLVATYSDLITRRGRKGCLKEIRITEPKAQRVIALHGIQNFQNKPRFRNAPRNKKTKTSPQRCSRRSSEKLRKVGKDSASAYSTVSRGLFLRCMKKRRLLLEVTKLWHRSVRLVVVVSENCRISIVVYYPHLCQWSTIFLSVWKRC